MRMRIRILSCIALSFLHLDASVNLIFGSRDSTIQLDNGATFVFESPAVNITGRIVKGSDANLVGDELYFNEGSFIDGPNDLELTGMLDICDLDASAVLSGNGAFLGKSGKFQKEIYVSGKNNKIEGGQIISNGIELYDQNTTVSINLLSAVKSNIYLNGGSIYLSGNNLSFDDKNRIIGPGKIYVNGNKLIFGAKRLEFNEPLCLVDAGDVQINDAAYLNSAWTFSGSCVVDGNNNFLCLMGDNAKIIIERGASVLFKNIVLHGVHTDNLFCMDNLGTITFQNADVYLDADFTFSLGHFDVLNSAKFLGNYKFIYNSSEPSLITSKATLSLDDGLTFSYDPGCMRKDLIVFEDDLAYLNINGATIHATVTGLQLTKGFLIVKQNSFLESEKTGTFDEGITFGDGTIENDFNCKVLKSSKLTIRSGSLKYKNVSPQAWAMENYMSELNINTGCNLYLYQDLDLGAGTINYSDRGGLYSVPGKKISGTFNAVGYLDYGSI